MSKHLPVLDGVRGLAALMVMWFHYFQNPHHAFDHAAGRGIAMMNTIGQTGVDLFFVLSGFLITRILLEAKSAPRYFLNFYARRSLRILPLYYFFLLFYLFVQPLLVGRELPQLAEYWWWLVYLPNIPQTFGMHAYGPGHCWSLGVEEHFYLAWPVLVFCLSRRALIAASFAIIALAFGLRVALLDAGHADVFFFTPTRFDALAFGTLLALLEPAIGARPELLKKFFLAALAAVGVPLFATYLIMSGSQAAWLQAVKYPLVAFGFCAFLGVAITLEEKSALARFFTSRAMRYLGRISYGLYVYHVTCFFWFDRVLPHGHPLLFLPLAFGFTIVVAHLSFILVERPFLRMKKHFDPEKIRDPAG